MQDTFLVSERDRFAQVVAARKSSKELVGIFAKLAESDKFSILAKPFLFADLLVTCAERVANGSLTDLLSAISDEWVGDILRRACPDHADLIVCALVLRALDLAAKDETVERRLNLMIHAGMVRDREHALQLAIMAGLSNDGETQLHALYARLAARPQTEPVCPF